MKYEPLPSFKEPDRIYAALCALLCTLMVSGNLIFRKFLSIKTFNIIDFEIGAGLLVFPLTFVITDIITECYGKKNAVCVVMIGFCIDLLMIAVVAIADYLPAVHWSTISNEMFHQVFGFYYISFISSIVAFMIAQVIDITLFMRIRKLTNGRHLWLRGNVSTISAQLIDTFCVLGILCIGGIVPTDKLVSTFFSSFAYKVLFCILSTPLLYLGLYLIRKQKKNVI